MGDAQRRLREDASSLEQTKSSHQALESSTKSARTAVSETGERSEMGHPTRSLLNQLRQDLPLLSPAERQIGEYVLEYPRQVLRLPTDQLAKEIGVSQGTLSNFSQTLGYSGFKAFRLDLAAEVNSPLHLNHAAIARGDTLQDIANKAISANIDALLTTLRSLDTESIERAVDAIQQARRVDLYALGISASVSLDAYNRFLSLGLAVNWLPDISNQMTSATLLTSQDVALAFSYAGETKATIKAFSLAHQQGATTIAITGNPHSSLARYADIKLVATPREPTAFRRNLHISSRISMLGLVDIIYLSLLNSLDDAALEKMESVLHFDRQRTNLVEESGR